MTAIEARSIRNIVDAEFVGVKHARGSSKLEAGLVTAGHVELVSSGTGGLVTFKFGAYANEPTEVLAVALPAVDEAILSNEQFVEVVKVVAEVSLQDAC